MHGSVELTSPGWNSVVYRGLLDLYREKVGFNVAIYGGDGGVLDAHACVLMAASPTLKTSMASDPIQGCHSVEISSISCDTWKLLLDFIYAGTVTVDASALDDVRHAAEQLQMTSLVQACRTSSAQNDAVHANDRLVVDVKSEPVLKSSPISLMPTPTLTDVKSKQQLAINQSSSATPSKSRASDVMVTEMTPKLSPTAGDIADGDQPLNLTKQHTGSAVNAASRENGESAPGLNHFQETITEQPQPSSARSVPETLRTDTKAQQAMASDPQVQAVMAVYYNQLMQYSMFAQMQQANCYGATSKYPPNGSSFPLPPGIIPPLIPPPPPPRQTQDDTYNENRQRRFACGDCGMLFFTRHVKEQHELTHTDSKPYLCKICGFRARQKAVIWRHKKNRHPDADSSVSMDSLTIQPQEQNATDAERDDEDASTAEESPGSSKTTAAHSHDHSIESATNKLASTKPEAEWKHDVIEHANTRRFVYNSMGQYNGEHLAERSYEENASDKVEAKSTSSAVGRADQLNGMRADGSAAAAYHPPMFLSNSQLNGVMKTPDHHLHHSKQMSTAVRAFQEDHDLATPRNEAASDQKQSTPRRDGSSMTDIENEVRKVERSEEGYMCRICSRHFKSRMILQEHMMTHYSARRYACCYCNYRAKQRAGLYNHMKVKHKGLKPIWPSRASKSNTSYKPTIGSPSVRERLNKSFRSQKSKTRLVKSVRSPSLRDSLNKSSLSPSLRDRLSKTLLNKSKQKISFHQGKPRKPCNGCKQSFRLRSTLMKHELIHMKIKRYTCKYCEFRGRKKIDIQIHSNNAHPEMPVRIRDLYNEKRDQSRATSPEPDTEDSTEEMITGVPHDYMTYYNTVMGSQRGLMDSQRDKPPTDSLFSPPRIKRELEEEMTHFPVQQTSEHVTPLSGLTSGGSGVTVLNGNVGILQLELPKSQQEALESPNTAFTSVGTPDKPHRCKSCGRCFRLRHVMEQHELTHFNFRKYMCDICGFRAKQKAVIYRHKKVKHPGHPGAGRVTLVPEPGPVFRPPVSRPLSQLAQPVSYHHRFPSASLSHASFDMSPRPLFGGVMHPSLAPPPPPPPQSPLMMAPPMNLKLSPSDDPELRHNNNKSSPHNQQKTAQDLSVKRMADDEEARMRAVASLLPSQVSKHWSGRYRLPEQQAFYPTTSSQPPDSPLNASSSSPPSSSTQSLMMLPPLAPISPENNSPSPTDTPEKKYTCYVCKRAFKHRHVLEQHYITHTGLRPYKCDFCDFAARQKASLWRHKQKHLIDQSMPN